MRIDFGHSKLTQELLTMNHRQKLQSVVSKKDIKVKVKPYWCLIFFLIGTKFTLSQGVYICLFVLAIAWFVIAIKFYQYRNIRNKK